MELRRWLLRGAVAGLIVLGIGGRLLMRVIAHREHRPEMVFTVPGTVTVLFAGTVAGLAAGLIYYLLRRFVHSSGRQTAVFILVCGLIAWRGVHGVLLVPQLMFMGLALVFLVIMIAMGRRSSVGTTQTSAPT
jgi:hypothetical protein